MTIPRSLTSLAALTLALIPVAAQDAELNLARNLPAQKARSLVRLRSVVDMSAAFQAIGGGMPIPAEMLETHGLATGLCVDPSGLVIASYSALAPASELGGIMGMMGGGAPEVDPHELPEFEQLEISLADGTVVTAKAVHADRDLDLIAVMPAEPLADDLAASLQTQTLPAEPKRLLPLDRAFTLGRLPESLGGGLAISTLTITAAVEEPARYVVDGLAAGRPVFTASGEFVGIGQGLLETPEPFATGGPPTPTVLPARLIRRFADETREALAKRSTEANAADGSGGR